MIGVLSGKTPAYKKVNLRLTFNSNCFLEICWYLFVYCVFLSKDKKLLELKLRRIAASNPPKPLAPLSPIVQTLDSAIYRINHYVVDKY